jgi:hypothetical protein
VHSSSDDFITSEKRKGESQSCCLLCIDQTRAKDKTYIYECRCDERLKTKLSELRNLHASDTLHVGELEHLKIKTRLIGEMFASVMGEYVFLK